jgi:glycine betaine/proline transport system substrate-binding protein
MAKKAITPFVLSSILSSLALTSYASDPASCQTVRFAEVGWADISATTALTSIVLDGLGYKTSSQLASIPMAYAGMQRKNLDVYLGAWMPSTASISKPFLENGSVERVRTNLLGAKYTLAVPDYLHEQGLKDFSDIAQFKEQLKGRIYGIESGNDGNVIIDGLIKGNQFSLGDFKLVESSEAGMLSQVRRAVSAKQPVVFLAWEPHPMNSNFSLRYLSGGDESFGPDYGAAVVDTHVRKGYLQECANVGKLLSNLEFQLGMENEVMDAIINHKAQPQDAAKAWLKQNPEVLQSWLVGVTHIDGSEALPAVHKALGL